MASWDRTAPTSSKGAAVFLLAYEFLSKKLKGNARREVTVEEAVETFQFIYDYMLLHFKNIEPVLGDIQKLIRGERSLPATGLPDMMAATYTDPVGNGLLKVTSGDAYICLVRYPKKGLPVIESINTFGASAHPASPHYTDQMEGFQNKKLKPMTLDKQTILQHAERIYQPM